MATQDIATPRATSLSDGRQPSAAALILLVCFAHAMAHFFELSFPSVEPLAADDYGISTSVTGWLIFCWRLPWGFGALVTGLVVDRHGGARMLAIFLLGCAACSVLVGMAWPLPMMFVLMFVMGSLASIYHPAGLSLISHVTTPENRGRALGMHGVFGSLGIGAAPLLAWAAISAGFTWRHYFWMLALPGAALGAAFIVYARRNGEPSHTHQAGPANQAEEQTNWASFAGLSGIGVLQGMVYAGTLSFLVRYLSNIDLAAPLPAAENVDQAAFWTSGVLLIGCIGQYAAGWWARPGKLEGQLMAVTLLNVPCLAAMAVAEGYARVAAAAAFALFHFMYQPLYNSLISKYTPRRRRSLSYGLSFTLTFGLGGFGAALAGYLTSDGARYGALAALATVATVFALWLWRRHAAPA